MADIQPDLRSAVTAGATMAFCSAVSSSADDKYNQRVPSMCVEAATPDSSPDNGAGAVDGGDVFFDSRTTTGGHNVDARAVVSGTPCSQVLSETALRLTHAESARQLREPVCHLTQAYSADNIMSADCASVRTSALPLHNPVSVYRQMSADGAIEAASAADSSSIVITSLTADPFDSVESVEESRDGAIVDAADMSGSIDGRENPAKLVHRRRCLAPAVSDTVLTSPADNTSAVSPQHRYSTDQRGASSAAITALLSSPSSPVVNGSANSAAGTNDGAITSSGKRNRRVPWYSVLKYSYKQRCDEFRRQFDVPADERLIVDYSCAQVDVGRMIYHGRLYLSQHFVCFVSNVIVWNKVTFCVSLTDVVSITKMNVLLFPSGITIETRSGDKFVLSSFASRDRAFSTLENIWLQCKEQRELEPSELWRLVHQLYGTRLGLTSDDDDYVLPSSTAADDADSCSDKTRQTEHCRHSKIRAVRANYSSSQLSSSTSGGRIREAGLPINSANQSASASALSTSAPAKSCAVLTEAVGGSSCPTKHVRPTSNDQTDSDDEEDSVGEDVGAGSVAVKLSAGPSRCDGNAHEGRHVTSLELPLHVDQVFTLLFTHSDFVEAFNSERKYYDVSAGDWQLEDSGVSGVSGEQKSRYVRFQIDVNHPLGKTTTVTEKQTMAVSSRPGRHYQVDAEVNNSGVPMADVFYLVKHYCLSSIGVSRSRLDIWCTVKFRKSTLFRGFIERTANDGMDEHHAALNRLLLETVCDGATTNSAAGAGGKHKRIKRRLHGAKTSPAEGAAAMNPGVGPGASGGAANSSAASTALSSGHPVLAGDISRGGSGYQNMVASTLVAFTTSVITVFASVPVQRLPSLLVLLSCTLLVLNGYMFVRVCQLSAQTDRLLSSDHAPEYAHNQHSFPHKHQHSGDLDWMQLLKRQQELHNDEKLLWRRVLSDISRLLKQTEIVLLQMQRSILKTEQTSPPSDDSSDASSKTPSAQATEIVGTNENSHKTMLSSQAGSDQTGNSF